MDEVKNKTAGFEAGAVDYITKPFEITEVKARVKTHLSLITARQQLAAQNARMRHSLSLAMEVQQNLIPRQDPKIEGCDVAGKILYCDETGGDYYDYLKMDQRDPGKIRIVVGDVSEHGIPSALLMTTARAFIRHRSFMSGSLSEIVGDVNRQFALDVGSSGRFMTLFLCELNAAQGNIAWVRAGHDPALLFDPRKGEFVDLAGEGVPLGVFPDSQYDEMRREIQPGQIIAICTDGIWEASDASGELFGKKRLKAIIRRHADRSAREILAAIMDAVGQFCTSKNVEDDQTAVIIKVLKLDHG
jgi:sigma-B regulation protein RsbU (phosphoserine phosphatase)